MVFHDAVKVIRGLDISPAAHPALTIELWVKINSNELPGRGYIIGHDDGGFDRAISVHVRISLSSRFLACLLSALPQFRP